ncbi:MAG TPA: N-acetylmuramoyl-L-alanine amidase [Acidimicrobiales bacterium]|nr:N-acetylmuramoyl-L-alanine amidase [Acidimicrobiales bacterium]
MTPATGRAGPTRILCGIAALGVLAASAGCGTTSRPRSGAVLGDQASTTASPPPTTLADTTTTAPPPTTMAPPRATAAPTTSPAATASVAAHAGGPLTGKVVAIDPGHNGGNFSNPSYINAPIWNGRASEACDTTGAATDGGYTEAQFNFNVAGYLAADLAAEGAKVVLTRTTNTGVGPCVTERAAIGNAAHADAAISIHADGGPPSGRGFAVLEPVADGPNNAIIGPSATLGTDIRDTFGAGTGEPVSSYDGVNGIQPRSDLAGTNLSTVPKVFIECANMRNATDAALLVTTSWQQGAAKALAVGITAFLTGR